MIVDVQNGFMEHDHMQAIVPRIQKLVTAWEGKGWPIVASRFVNLPNSNWQRLRNWHEMQNEPETRLYAGLIIDTPFVFKKATYSAWSDEVSSVCVTNDVQEVVITGVDTNECVLATALGVFDAGYRPLVARDATASSGGQEPHDMALQLLTPLLGAEQIVDTQSLLD
jgi:nicotinamidase-related amidase